LSEEKEEKTLKLSVHALELIRKPVESQLCKIHELLTDHYTGLILLGENDLITLMELKVSSQILASYLKDLCDQAQEAQVTHLHLYPKEVQMIGSLAKGLSTVPFISIGNTNLRNH
jgi:hypothetical protein